MTTDGPFTHVLTIDQPCIWPEHQDPTFLSTSNVQLTQGGHIVWKQQPAQQ